ncbi:MAG: hypothetical protein GXO15_05155 [Crenarchaeota archaeon]|nr:hypothetical protein [Thermoproteota archaeon]
MAIVLRGPERVEHVAAAGSEEEAITLLGPVLEEVRFTTSHPASRRYGITMLSRDEAGRLLGSCGGCIERLLEDLCKVAGGLGGSQGI